jgi:hypothetical protein
LLVDDPRGFGDEVLWIVIELIEDLRLQASQNCSNSVARQIGGFSYAAKQIISTSELTGPPSSVLALPARNLLHF